MVLHICQREAWERALTRGIYETDALLEDDFIHLSYPHQAVKVANFLYHYQKDLLLLCIDPEKARAEIKVEKLGTSEPFPHLYGPLNLEAVVGVLEFPPDQTTGTFVLPDDLETFV